MRTSQRLAVQARYHFLRSSMPMPEFDQAVYGIAFRAAGPAQGEQSVVRKVIAIGATTTVTMPSAPALSTPAEGATGIDHTSALAWMNATGFSYVIAIHTRTTSRSPPAAIHAIAAGGTAKLPNLGLVGAKLPLAKKYQWSVIGYPLVTSVDTLASGGGNVDWYCTAYSPIGPDEVSCTFSAIRTLTTT